MVYTVKYFIQDLKTTSDQGTIPTDVVKAANSDTEFASDRKVPPSIKVESTADRSIGADKPLSPSAIASKNFLEMLQKGKVKTK